MQADSHSASARAADARLLAAQASNASPFSTPIEDNRLTSSLIATDAADTIAFHPCRSALRILYVEDNCELREAMGMLLESDERQVTVCATAEEALQHDAEKPFDLVITDVTLPGMTGTDLARCLLGKHPARWLVLCSGYQFAQEGATALGPNVRALLKPFDMDELEMLLDEVEAGLQATRLS